MITSAGSGQPPDEVLSAATKTEAYLSWRATTDLRAPYRLAPEFLQGTKPDAEYDTAEAPLIVFINARSGGRVGPQLAGVLARAVGSSQVFDLSEYRPDKVLTQIWRNLQQQEQLGNQHAALVRSRLRVLACGGDGTIAWLLKVIKQLDLQPQPPVAIMPLGTGNDLSRSFHWGPEFEPGWIKGHASVYNTLKRVADARVTDLDCWRLRLLLPNSTYKPAKTYAMEEVQAAEQHVRQQQPGCAGEGHNTIMEGLFWNYFSVGADAQAAYNFHHLRDNHPALASNRVANQFWYSTFSCTSGWFCGTIPSVSRFSKVQVLQAGSSSWTDLLIPPSIKALVFVNLQSYAGGRNIWGQQPPKQASRWRTPCVDDGLIEVVGFHSGYHAMAVMASGAHLANGKRLAQVRGIRLALHDALARPDGEAGSVFMQLDGEPWMQKVPAGSSAGHVMLEVVHAGVSKMLCNDTPPQPHPQTNMTQLLTQEQAAAYLTIGPDAAALPTELHYKQEQREKLEAHVAACTEPAAAASLAQTNAELPSAAQTCTALNDSPQMPGRLAHTDGGAPCSSPRLDNPVVLSSRPSLNLAAAQPGSSSSSCNTPSPASSDSTDAPSAVAVIETRGVSGSGMLKQKVGAVEEGSTRPPDSTAFSSPSSTGLPGKQQVPLAFLQERGRV